MSQAILEALLGGGLGVGACKVIYQPCKDEEKGILFKEIIRAINLSQQ